MNSRLSPLRRYKVLCLLVLSILINSSMFGQNLPVSGYKQSPTACTQSPIITCPADVTICIGESIEPAKTGMASAKPGGPDCKVPNISFSDKVSPGKCANSKIIQRIWVAQDPDDVLLRSFCVQLITQDDVKAPTITGCPNNGDILSNNKCYAIYKWQLPKVTDDCGNFTSSFNHVSGDTFYVGRTEVKYTYTDGCGNSSICNFVVHVIDNCCQTAGEIVCPNTYITCNGSSIDSSVSGVPRIASLGPACAKPTLSYIDSTIYVSNCSTRVHRKWIATSKTNPHVKDSCVQVIIRQDSIAPTLFCPNNITVTSGADCKAKVDWVNPLSVDNCGGAVSLQSTFSSGSIFNQGTHTVKYTAMDQCGNSSTCSFNILVRGNCCEKPPIINCPQVFETCPGASIDPLVSGKASALPGQSGCGTPLISFTDQKLFESICSTKVIRTWTAVDPDNNTLKSTCEQEIYQADKQGPTISFCPSSFSIDPNAECKAEANWTEPTATDACGTVTWNSNYLPGAFLAVGTTTIQYTATDDCDNTSTCWFNIKVNDNCCNKPPKINCPPDYSACPNADLNPEISGKPTVTKANPQCAEPIVTFIDQLIFKSGCASRIERTWYAKDPNNTSLIDSCVQVITLNDKTSPEIENCPKNITVDPGADCTVKVEWTPPAVSDNCGSSVTLISTLQSGSTFNVGTSTIVYRATDACGNTKTCSFTITVTENCCNKPPKINCPIDFSGCPNDDLNPNFTGKPSITKSNPKCSDPILLYEDQTVSSSECKIHIIRKWIAIDPLNNALRDSCYQNLSLLDTLGPVITFCPASFSVDPGKDCKAEVSWTEPTATDLCGNVVWNSNYLPGAFFTVGTTTIAYTASDDCGNTATCWFNVKVNDNCCNKPPKIDCPKDYKGCPGDDLQSENTGRPIIHKASTQCDEPIVRYVDTKLFENNCSTRIERKWIATDPNNLNLSDSCIQNIILEDKIAPEITFCPLNITVEPGYNCYAKINWVAPTITDNCGEVMVSVDHMMGDSLFTGTTRITYVATDKCGNTASCWFTITVTDNCCNKPPSIICPNPYIACPGSSTSTTITGVATALPGKSNCENPVLSFSDNIISSGPCPGQQKIIRTWTAIDPMIASLVKSCEQVISLKDSIAPHFTSFPKDVTISANGNCDIPVNWEEPVAVDDCGLNRIESNYKQGQTFNSGTYTISYIAYDNCGNTSKQSFKLTITDADISVQCPKDTSVFRIDPYQPGRVVSWDDPIVKHCTPCPDSLAGFIYMGEYRGHRYFCSRAPENWINAKIICQSLGGYLATINDAGENNYLVHKLMGLKAWVGGNDARNEGNFEWLTNDAFIYKNWAKGEPNNGENNEDYIEILPDGTWNDQNGIINNEFICELPCYEIKQISGPANGTMVPCGLNKITYVASKDGATDTCSFNIQVDCDSFGLYCGARGQDASYMWIDKVSFADINNVSGNNRGYGNFSSNCGNITPGNAYDLCLTPAYSGTRYIVYWKVWIDYNGDYLFDPATEEVARGSGNSTLCANIIIPTTFKGPTVRMRVSMSYGTYPTGPCSKFLYGEVEDYCLKLKTGMVRNVYPNGQTARLKCVEGCDPGFDADLDERINNKPDIDIFPNPANDFVQMILVHAEALSAIQVFDASGKSVYRNIEFNHSTQHELNTQDWKNGIYTVVIETTEKNKIVKRFTILH